MMLCRSRMSGEEDDVVPEQIELEDVVFNVEFHPNAPLVAAALITGTVYLFDAREIASYYYILEIF